MNFNSTSDGHSSLADQTFARTTGAALVPETPFASSKTARRTIQRGSRRSRPPGRRFTSRATRFTGTRSDSSSPRRWRSARGTACVSACSVTGLALSISRLAVIWPVLARAGVEARSFNPPRLESPFGWISRDHRKVITIDGRMAFVSGLCVGRAWVGDPARHVEPWRDTGIAIEGPAVADIDPCVRGYMGDRRRAHSARGITGPSVHGRLPGTC